MSAQSLEVTHPLSLDLPLLEPKPFVLEDLGKPLVSFRDVSAKGAAGLEHLAAELADDLLCYCVGCWWDGERIVHSNDFSEVDRLCVVEDGVAA